MTDAVLPELFDPMLDYLADHLPPQLYDTVETLLTHTYSLFSSLFTLARTMISNSPVTWDIQQILPPLITLLAAYLALVSFYRTTSWMIRTAFAFAKWGFIITTLGGFAGYMLANANADGGNGLAQFGNGLLPTLGGVLLGMFNPDAQNNAGRNQRAGPTSRPRARTSQRKKGQDRPKASESWDKHREWQYSEQQHHQADGGDGANAQQIIGNIIGSAGKVLKDSGIWDKAREAAEGLSKSTKGQSEEGSSKRRKGKGSESG
ncbi:uncharacterized protein PHACADRAFT_255060 [Phanerochaete carnosa HHB-10118-sp]|uniref:Uncharacterized protein n=1 Tax=Phanerochaete carnosa (strain HHB-10118-sp) TaxID=650164 RepID=K5V447_PHACS|nr:uncharacterized protein PHACADRAFT_255060 [Phanerochaete carnosa HHB-10118-sp]EKM57351.1 hypothetical protein PHACADRAFT_255060 [Phanerochaete carnosa HHB-10118-sp]